MTPTTVDVPRYTAEGTAADDPLVRRFAEEGYLVLDDLGVPDLVATIDRAVAEVDAHDRGTGRVQDAWLFSSAVRDLALAPGVLRVVEALYGRPPIPFQTLSFRVGTEQATHSDAVHFGSDPTDFVCGAWIALEDVGARNGPLHVVPGSHLLPLYEPSHLGLDAGRDSYPQYEERIAALIDEQGLARKEIHLQRGQAVLWAANVLHGGSPIAQPGSTRRSQVTHYYFPGCRYFTPILGGEDQRVARRPVDISTRRLVPIDEADTRSLRTRLHDWTTWLAARNPALGRQVHHRRYRNQSP